MYLAQVEHCWLNDYVTVGAGVSGELLPTGTSVTFHEVTQSINLLTAQVLLFRHEIPGTNRRQDTHSLSVGPVTVDSVVGAPLPASGFFEFARVQGSTLAVFRYPVIPSTPDFTTEYQIRRHSNPAGLPTFAAIWGPDFRASIIRLTCTPRVNR